MYGISSTQRCLYLTGTTPSEILPVQSHLRDEHIWLPKAVGTTAQHNYHLPTVPQTSGPRNLSTQWPLIPFDKHLSGTLTRPWVRKGRSEWPGTCPQGTHFPVARTGPWVRRMDQGQSLTWKSNASAQLHAATLPGPAKQVSPGRTSVSYTLLQTEIKPRRSGCRLPVQATPYPRPPSGSQMRARWRMGPSLSDAHPLCPPSLAHSIKRVCDSRALKSPAQLPHLVARAVMLRDGRWLVLGPEWPG